MIKSKKQGFTLIELLIVLAIIGILSAAGFMGLRRFTISLELRQAQQVIVRELNRARSDARKLGLTQRVSWTKDSLTVEQDGDVIRTVNLSEFRGVEIDFTDEGKQEDSLSYSAPYSRTTATEKDIVLKRNNATASIFVFGIRGKVYTSAPTWSDAN